MPLKCNALHNDFAAEIQGIDITVVDDVTFSEIERAADQYSLLVLRNQPLDDDQQMDLTRRFGEPEFGHLPYGRDGSIEYIGHIGNIDSGGKQLPLKDQKVKFGTGNYMWHSDSSFRPVPSKFSISFAYEVTPEGGEIEFASTRAAYERLPQEKKNRIQDLVGIHDYTFSRTKVATVPQSIAESLPPVRQRLVRCNPENNLKNYYVGSHLKEIEGWNNADSRELIDDLIQRAVEPEHVYSHHWQVGDLLIWDNRCLLHRGSAYDADRYRRRMHQTPSGRSCDTVSENLNLPKNEA